MARRRRSPVPRTSQSTVARTSKPPNPSNLSVDASRLSCCSTVAWSHPPDGCSVSRSKVARYLSRRRRSSGSTRPLDEEGITNSWMRVRFEQWMAQHSRVYSDPVEMEQRFKIFQKNVERIESVKQNGDGSKRLFKVGVNAFADLTDEEFRFKFIGLKGLHPFHSRSTGRFRYENFTQPSEAKDWREDGAVTPIKFQGECASCWALSSVAAMEGINQIKTGELTPLSEQQLVDCEADNHGCDGTGRMDRAFTFIQGNHGHATQEAYPYNGTPGECRAPEEGAVTIDSYENVPEGDEVALMQAVANQPVSVGLEGEGQDFRDYAGGVYNGDCGTDFNHAVTLVGYGTDEEGTDFWIAKNSWGEQWGEDVKFLY